MMEGISGEAASLAGHLKLDNLCWIYDNNHITIEGNTALAFSEDVATRFIGLRLERHPRRRRQRPRTMLRTRFQAVPEDDRTGRRSSSSTATSATGAPNKQDTSAAHGEPLGEEEIRLTKKIYGWPEDAKFLVPDGVYAALPATASASAARSCATPGSPSSTEYKEKYPELADQLDRMQHRELPDGWDKDLPTFPADAKGTGHPRIVRQGAERHCAKNIPWLIGGSADLAPSTKTRLTFEGAGDFEADRLRRPQLPLRHPRTRHGRDPQRHVAVARCGPTARPS